MIDIYALIDPITNQVRYIGKSTNSIKRFYRHLYESKKSTRTHKSAWIRSLLKQDLKPELFILDIVDVEEWAFWEVYYMNLYKSWGFNLTNMVEGGVYIPDSKGDKNSAKREDVRRKISESRKGMIFSKEHCTNLSIAKQGVIPPSRKGIPWTEDQRIKIRAIWAAKRRSDDSK